MPRPQHFDGTIFISASVPQEELSASEIATQGRIQFVSPAESKVVAKQEHGTEAASDLLETLRKISGALRKNLPRAIANALNPRKK